MTAPLDAGRFFVGRAEARQICAQVFNLIYKGGIARGEPAWNG